MSNDIEHQLFWKELKKQNWITKKIKESTCRLKLYIGKNANEKEKQVECDTNKRA